MSLDTSDRYRDSISSSDAYYSNPYRGDHDYIKGYQQKSNQIKIQDSLESSQQQIEKRILEKFRQNQFRLPLGRYAIIGQIGKYFIFAVLLPPYIFFYGMPKLLIEQMIPWLGGGYKFAAKKLKKLTITIASFLALAAQKIKTLRPKKKIRSPDKEYLFKIILSDLRKKWSESQERLKSLLKPYQESYQKLMRNLGEFFQKRIDRLKTIYHKFSEKWQRLNRAFFSTLKNKTLKLRQRIEKIKSRLEKPLKEIRQATKKVFEKIKEPIIATLNQMAHLFVTSSNMVISFLPFFTKPVVITGKLAAKGYHLVKGIYKSAANWLKEGFKAATQPIVKAVAAAAQKTVEKLQKTFEKVSRPISAALKFIFEKSKNLILTLQKITKKPLKRGKEFSEKAKEFLKTKYIAILKQVKKGAEVFKIWAKNLPWKLWNFFVRLIKAVLRLTLFFLKKGFYYSQVSLAWSRILCRHFWHTLSEHLS